MEKEKGICVMISKTVTTTLRVQITTNKNNWILNVPIDMREDELSFNIQEQFFK